ncbi:MAG: hypothetical protein ACXW00_12235 [Methylobacter sp.]
MAVQIRSRRICAPTRQKLRRSARQTEEVHLVHNIRLGDQPAAAGDLVPKTGSANNGDGARNLFSALESETSWPFGGNVDQ